MKSGPLRFAVMCNGRTLARWQAQAVTALIESGVALPALVIVDATPSRAAMPATRLGRIWDLISRPNLLWRVFAAASRPAAMDDVPLPEALAGVPQIRCAVTRKGRFSEYFDAGDVAAIRSFDLDFALRFAFGIVRGDVLSSTRYGIWSFHHGDELAYRGGPPCFWEMYHRDPVTGAILQRLTDRLDAGVVLRKGFLRTIDYSYARNVNQLFFETASWPVQAANEIAEGLLTRVHAAPSSTTSPVRRLPSNLTVLAFLPQLAINIVRRLLIRKRQEEWNIGIVRMRPQQLLDGKPVENVRWYPPSKGRWAADPMAVAQNGTVRVLCEEMRVDDGKAHISATTFDGSAWTALQPALDTGTHASYPYLFSFGGELYCVPETFEANEVRLYRVTGDVPHRFEFVATLLENFPAVDSTVFQHGDLYWLLCSPQEKSGSHLHAFYAREPFGPWVPHPSNPVKIDIRGARPAGPPFVVDGALYRPAQDSSRTYGGRVVINRVVALSPTEFVEVPHAHVGPEKDGPFGEGLHTVSFAGDYCVIDGKRWARGR